MSAEYWYKNYLNDPYVKLNQPGAGKSDWNEYQKTSVNEKYEMPSVGENSENLVRLASVKTGIYNPQLPSYRRIDRDEYLGKLPDEHCRHTWKLDSDNQRRSEIDVSKVSYDPRYEVSSNNEVCTIHKPGRNPTYEEMAKNFRAREPEISEITSRFKDLRSSYDVYKQQVHNRIYD